MKFCFAFALCASSLLVGCNQPATSTTTRSATTSTTAENHYKITGNRSADPLGNYGSDNTNTVLTKDGSSVAQHSGSTTLPSTNSVRGGR